MINVMKKPLNKIIPFPDTPFLIYFQPVCQPRLMPKTVFIHRDTCYPADIRWARQEINCALYKHMEILILETWWAELPYTLKRWCVKQGARIVLCKTLREAMNSADVKWLKAG